MIDLRLFGRPCVGCGVPADVARVDASVVVAGRRYTGNVVEPCGCVLNLRPVPVRDETAIELRRTA